MAKSITFQLVGGLGNQLFIYYAGVKASKDLACELRLDASRISKKYNKHESSILDFEVPFRVMAGLHTKYFLGIGITNASQTLTNTFPKLLALVERIARVHSSREIGGDSRFEEIRPGQLVRGYFQTADYYDSVRSLGNFKDLRLRKESKWFIEQTDLILKERPIIVHVRRGDYADAKNQAIGLLHKKYFEEAVAQLRAIEEFRESNLWVFSDSIDELQGVFNFGPGVRYIRPPASASAAESLLLMSKGVGFVISNSTYSWWSATLSGSSNVIAPSPWYRSMPEPVGLIQSNWIRKKSIWSDLE